MTERDPAVLMARLQCGEIDLWCYPEATGRHLSREAPGNFFAFTVGSFQQALYGLRQERDAAGISRYETILKEYIPRSSSNTS